MSTETRRIATAEDIGKVLTEYSEVPGCEEPDCTGSAIYQTREVGWGRYQHTIADTRCGQHSPRGCPVSTGWGSSPRKCGNPAKAPGEMCPTHKAAATRAAKKEAARDAAREKRRVEGTEPAIVKAVAFEIRCPHCAALFDTVGPDQGRYPSGGKLACAYCGETFTLSPYTADRMKDCTIR